jgi:dienelactone hydrolase
VEPVLLALALAAAAGPGALPPRGELVEGQRCASDPSQTYTLYLPRAYPDGRRWPVLLIMDARGRSVLAAGRFAEAAEEYGFVLVSSNDTRSDTDPGPNIKALRALWPEVHTRIAVDPRRVYLAGFSGTAILALDVARRSGEIAGVIASGGRWEEGHTDERLAFPCFGTAGDSDFNYAPMVSLHDRLRRWGTPERLEVFDGPHGWMPPELAREAIAWMELQAMKAGLRSREDAMVQRLLAEDVARAADLESEGRLLDARRRYEAVASTFDGLADVAAARREAEHLARMPAVRAALDDEKRWDRYEQSMRRRHDEAFFDLIEAPAPVAVVPFVSRFRVEELQRHAAAPGYEGSVGRRLLASLVAQAGFYIPREMRRKGDAQHAAASLDIATRARPESASLWYQLACARALAGFHREALDALEEAVTRGFDDRAQIAEDEDLASLRDDDRFRALLSRPSPPSVAVPEPH